MLVYSPTQSQSPVTKVAATVTPPSYARPGSKISSSSSKSKSTEKDSAQNNVQHSWSRAGALSLEKKDKCIQVDMPDEEFEGEIIDTWSTALPPENSDKRNQRLFEPHFQVSSEEPPRYLVSDCVVDTENRTKSYDQRHNPEFVYPASQRHFDTGRKDGPFWNQPNDQCAWNPNIQPSAEFYYPDTKTILVYTPTGLAIPVGQVDGDMFCPRQTSNHTIFEGQYFMEPTVYHNTYPFPPHVLGHTSNPLVQHHGINNVPAPNMYLVPMNGCSGSDHVSIKPMASFCMLEERHSNSNESREKNKSRPRTRRTKLPTNRDRKKYEILQKPKLSSYEEFPVLSAKPKHKCSNLDQSCEKKLCEHQETRATNGHHVVDARNNQDKKKSTKKRGKTKKAMHLSHKREDATDTGKESNKKTKPKTSVKVRPSKPKKGTDRTSDNSPNI
uniref:Uncharacterized protein n=1 Tax=Leptocylindrus danicus TaxID=163516 RepID=A0A7S2KK81_9STRA|mmetsp:Transcript_23506/g.35255  ORF Transcript_23506/g.35255 Transcript_23506/m.35255 type:complete len:442 (+) Transcript_23506:63-1388(+)